MFIRKDTPTIMDGLVIRYQLESDVYTGEINASCNGVSLRGTWPIISSDDSVILEEYIARARVQSQHLASDRGKIFGPRVQPLSEEDISRIIGPIPVYEAWGRD